ncbi:MAG: YigZ family protein [Lachnospiraceae bacterium]|nr:YigZ family protein [Lachnospiraceae bacterium]
MIGYRILMGEASGEYEEKKSKFIAVMRPVSSEQDALDFIAEIKKKRWDARHNCSAFVLGKNNELTRCSDDGEPSGTAGRPMLEVLTGSGIHDVAVVVTRYFGGVLLGTGGLVRAYTQAVKNALESADTGVMRDGCRVVMNFPYRDIDTVKKYVEAEGVTTEQEDYLENVRFTCIFPEENYEKGVKDLVDKTGGRIIFSEPERCSFLDKDKG